MGGAGASRFGRLLAPAVCPNAELTRPSVGHVLAAVPDMSQPPSPAGAGEALSRELRPVPRGEFESFFYARPRCFASEMLVNEPS